jgi:YegS/Rv2252/BmrU family lipid kinase
MRKRFLMVVNPIAGIEGSTLVRAVVSALEAGGATVETARPTSGPDARRCAREACQSRLFDAVIAVGGDGTIRQVAAGAQGTDVPIGIVPTGTGNILAHETGIKANPQEIARILVEGRIIPVQGGLANGEPFLLMASAGFDGRVTAVVDRRMQRRFGKAAYTRPVLKALFHPLDELDVTIDNVRHQANWVIVTNSRYYGGTFVLTPQTTVSDGGLCAVLFHAQSRLDHAFQLLALARGRLDNHRGVRMIPCERVTISASRSAAPTQIDGDFLGSTPLDVRIGQQVVHVIVGA